MYCTSLPSLTWFEWRTIQVLDSIVLLYDPNYCIVERAAVCYKGINAIKAHTVVKSSVGELHPSSQSYSAST